MKKIWLPPLMGLLLCGVLTGCAVTGTGTGNSTANGTETGTEAAVGSAGRDPAYQCERGIVFTVKFANDTALLSGLRTPSGSSGITRDQELLLRDAGGQGSQAFYSNPRMRAEFGLGASGREALLRYPSLPSAVRCLRD